VNWKDTSRILTLAAMLLASPCLFAQRGGGPGGPPGGGMGGPPPGMGGGVPRDRNGAMGDRESGALPRPSGPQLGLPGRWWDDRKTMKTLSLRSDQQHKMDDIFNGNKGTLQNLFSNLQREEARLTSMSPQDLQDEGKVFAAIDRVATARADLEKESAHILMQIRQQLDPSQLSKLDSEIAGMR